MPEPQDKLRYACEDEAWQHYMYAGNELWLASIAVSLKRIADVMCPDPDGLKPSILLALHDIESHLRRNP